jgi:peptidoglycan/xylan/chitin deacetylase (PgdA/CDA1 family)
MQMMIKDGDMPSIVDGAGYPADSADLGRILPLGRAVIKWLSPGGSNSRLSILIYHRVLPGRDPLFPDEVDARAFDAQIALLKACFNIIPLRDAIRGLREGRLPSRAACITFDDGYADNAEVALPILQKHGIPATFFIATRFLDGGRMWNDTVIELVRHTKLRTVDLSPIGLGRFDIGTDHERRHAIYSMLGKLKYLPMEIRAAQIEQMCGLMPGSDLPTDLMMNTKQVRELDSVGMEIGAHTVNHPILARLTSKAAYSEIAIGKEALESIIGAPVQLFAYPNGKPNQDYLPEHVSLVKKLGFIGAVSTAWGAARHGDDIYQLPRFTPWDGTPLKFTIRLARNILRRAQTI